MTKSNHKHHKNAGFTLIEVLLATILFALAIVAVVGAQRGSLRSIQRAEKLFTANTLAKSKMSEMEIKFMGKLEKDGFKAALGKESGSFPAPYQNYSWTAELKEAKVKITNAFVDQTVQNYMGDDAGENATAQADAFKLIVTNFNKALKENLAELNVEIKWKQGARVDTMRLMTHLIPPNPKVELTTTAEEASE